LPNELDDDIIFDYSPPFKKQRTMEMNLDFDSSDDDCKWSLEEKNICLQQEAEDVEYQQLMKKADTHYAISMPGRLVLET
jgi:hypothetical protein